jgi:hypothetical protein
MAFSDRPARRISAIVSRSCRVRKRECNSLSSATSGGGTVTMVVTPVL